MNSFNVLVYDDEPQIAGDLAERIRSVHPDATVTSANVHDFNELMHLIHRRRKISRCEGIAEESGDPLLADSADVVVVDYDLYWYEKTTDTTGSRLAYLLRCFLKCGFIAILNRDRVPNAFDSKLASSGEDFADLHTSSNQIDNPGLWQAPFDGYRPWYWPVIPDAKIKFEQCVTDVRDNYDTPILKFLGLDPFIDWMPRSALGHFEGEKEVQEVTFKDFSKLTSAAIDPKENLSREQKIRVIAARITGLLNSFVLPSQNVLVDAPHLVSRFPSLIRKCADNIDTWNALCDPTNTEMDTLLADDLKNHQFKHPHWLWKPAWYWQDVNKDENFVEVRDPWAAKEIDWVFCEDISRFVPLEFARSFIGDVSPPFTKRFVFNGEVAGAKEWVSQIGGGGHQDPSQVVYVPEFRFSL